MIFKTLHLHYSVLAKIFLRGGFLKIYTMYFCEKVKSPLRPHPTPGVIIFTTLNLQNLRMLQHEFFQLSWSIGFWEEDFFFTNVLCIFICKNLTSHRGPTLPLRYHEFHNFHYWLRKPPSVWKSSVFSCHPLCCPCHPLCTHCQPLCSALVHPVILCQSLYTPLMCPVTLCTPLSPTVFPRTCPWHPLYGMKLLAK